jgi:hypothetical protein
LRAYFFTTDLGYLSVFLRPLLVTGCTRSRSGARLLVLGAAFSRYAARLIMLRRVTDAVVFWFRLVRLFAYVPTE